MKNIDTVIQSLDDVKSLLDCMKKREEFAKERLPVPAEFDTDKEVTFEMLMQMEGQPVYDSRIAKWVLVEIIDGQIWLRGTGKIHFPIMKEYPIINPMYLLKGS